MSRKMRMKRTNIKQKYKREREHLGNVKDREREETCEIESEGKCERKREQGET